MICTEKVDASFFPKLSYDPIKDFDPVSLVATVPLIVVECGEAGALRALDILRDELTRTMQLCGVPRIADIDASLLAPR